MLISPGQHTYADFTLGLIWSNFQGGEPWPFLLSKDISEKKEKKFFLIHVNQILRIENLFSLLQGYGLKGEME